MKPQKLISPINLPKVEVKIVDIISPKLEDTSSSKKPKRKAALQSLETIEAFARKRSKSPHSKKRHCDDSDSDYAEYSTPEKHKKLAVCLSSTQLFLI